MPTQEQDVKGRLAWSSIRYVHKRCRVADFTDNTNTTGYIDFPTNAIPAGVLVLGWWGKNRGAFAGDTTAVVQVGISGTLDYYSAVTNGSVFAANQSVGSITKTNHPLLDLSAQTPRVTITGSSDFTLIKTNGNGDIDICIYFIKLPDPKTLLA